MLLFQEVHDKVFSEIPEELNNLFLDNNKKYKYNEIYGHSACKLEDLNHIIIADSKLLDEKMKGHKRYMISFYKSIVDQDRASIVICNLKHEIIYMNPAAVNSYAKRGGDKLIGRSLLDCHNQESRDKIQKVVDWFAADESHNLVYTFHNEKQNKDVYMVALREDGRLIGYYEKHEYRNAETMKQYDLW